jgi:hypothetical protein
MQLSLLGTNTMYVLRVQTAIYRMPLYGTTVGAVLVPNVTIMTSYSTKIPELIIVAHNDY